jgi:RNA polymerase sigma-70 factor, ECF subfamily
VSLEVRDLYERYFDQVYKTTFYIVRDLELAKDATQETFIKVFKNEKQLQDPTKVESWIITIATRTAIDFYNKRRKLEQVVDLNEENFSSEKEMKNEDVLDLDQYLNDINPEQKQILVLKYIENLSEKEIASRLKIKVGTVKSRLSRARKKILEKHQLGGVHNG